MPARSSDRVESRQVSSPPKILVVAPHPDDEVLGCGGTIARYARAGGEVTVAVVTKGTPLFPAAQVRRVRREAREANLALGSKLCFLDLPVTTLQLMPEHRLNGVFDRLVGTVRPDVVFLPYRWDRHEDHRQVFDACMVALRPDGRRPAPRRVCCYETCSETHWSAAGVEPAFEPNWYVDITDTLASKLSALRAYASQIEGGVPARSVEAVEALARFRGSTVGMVAAESFLIVRDTWPAGR
ncbi:MAG: PIG-L family deacetylase [Phycisphaerae bacterium]|nr:PIG-L family deacetylase [Phycisphaerae bacterium]